MKINGKYLGRRGATRRLPSFSLAPTLSSHTCRSVINLASEILNLPLPASLSIFFISSDTLSNLPSTELKKSVRILNLVDLLIFQATACWLLTYYPDSATKFIRRVHVHGTHWHAPWHAPWHARVCVLRVPSCTAPVRVLVLYSTAVYNNKAVYSIPVDLQFCFLRA